MNKYILVLSIVFISFLSACKEEVKTNVNPNTANNKVQINETDTQKSKKESNSTKIENPTYKVINEKENLSKKQGSNTKLAKTERVDEPEMINLGNDNNYKFASYDLPSACDLLPKAWLLETFKIDEDELLIKDSSSSRTKYARSCFFKWNVPYVANGGIMLQLQKNPIPEETDNWVKGYLAAKKLEGESSMNQPDVRMTYKDLPGLGDEAVYNFGLNRCYWRVGDDQLFMLAFNLGMTEQDERNIAVKIGNEVVRNFKKIKK